VKEGYSKVPEELWSNKKPDLKYLRVFGCNAYYHTPSEKRKKLDPKGKKGVFIGFSEEVLGWKVLDITTMKVVVSKDVVFDEQQFTEGRELRRLKGDSDGDVDDDHYYEELTFNNETKLVIEVSKELDNTKVNSKGKPEISKARDSESDYESDHGDTAGSSTPVRRSARARMPPNYYGKVHANDIGQAHTAVEKGVSKLEPSSYEEILSYDKADRDSWLLSIRAEEESLYRLGVFVDVSEEEMKGGLPIVKCKLVFKNKIDSLGAVNRNKTRMVAKGYTQRMGVDYNETFAPVLQYKSLKFIMNIVAERDLEFKQMDVKTAFLFAKVKERIYVMLPDGFKEAGCVKKLAKALYGIKQAPHEWNEELHTSLVSMGYKACVSDSCVYHKTSKTGRKIFVTVFVDDITVAYDKEDESEYLVDKGFLCGKYEISDLGDVKHLLGMRITRDRSKRVMTLDQGVAVMKLLKECSMENCHSVRSPEIQIGKGKVPTEEEKENNATLEGVIDYRSAVGSLNYLAGATRLDISHVVGVLSRKLTAPSVDDWNALKRVLRYLKGSVNYGLRFGGNADGKQQQSHPQKATVEVYTDANWAGDKEDRKSTTGTVIKVNGSVVHWLSKKQKTVSLSSAESEYMALAVSVQETLWIRSFMSELEMLSEAATTILCDNQAAIAIAQNPTHISRTKHIDIRHHFIRDEVKKGSICVQWISTQDQLADIMTKGLGPQLFLRFREQMMSLVQ
jgi:hypothetical protein